MMEQIWGVREIFPTLIRPSCHPPPRAFPAHLFIHGWRGGHHSRFSPFTPTPSFSSPCPNPCSEPSLRNIPRLFLRPLSFSSSHNSFYSSTISSSHSFFPFPCFFFPGLSSEFLSALIPFIFSLSFIGVLSFCIFARTCLKALFKSHGFSWYFVFPTKIMEVF